MTKYKNDTAWLAVRYARCVLVDSSCSAHERLWRLICMALAQWEIEHRYETGHAPTESERAAAWRLAGRNAELSELAL